MDRASSTCGISGWPRWTKLDIHIEDGELVYRAKLKSPSS